MSTDTSSDDSRGEPISINGTEYTPETVQSALQLATNGHDLQRDQSVLRRLGQQFDGDRDLYDALGYDEDLGLEDYRAKYERGGIAKRLVEIYPKDTWKDPPTVVDQGSESATAFEKQANRLIRKTLNHYWRRVDIAAGLGEYAVLFLGFKDGQPLAEPVQEDSVSSPDALANIEIFPQSDVEGWTLGKNSDTDAADPSHERYSKPVTYELDFADVDADETAAEDDTDIRDVHWQRVIHVPTEDLLETDLKGIPRLKPLYNRLEDLEKVIGSAAEAFWTTAQPKIIGNVADGYADLDAEDLSSTKDDLEKLVHDLQKYMLTSGMEFEVLDGDTPDPSGAADSIVQQIASTAGVPKNKLLGNEMGERSTTQDRRNWFDNVGSRQQNYAGPLVVRESIDHLIGLGILPEPADDDYGIEWESLFEMTDEERADLESKRAQALSGSQLAMSLPAEAKMGYIKTGEFPDMEETPSELPVNEADPRVRDQFDRMHGNASFDEGAEVETPDGLGVVTGVLTESVEFDGVTREASSDSPLYVVALADGGFDFYTASDLTGGSIRVEGIDNPSSDLEEAASNVATNDERWDYPPSWRESETPNRAILLKAWAGLGGRFTSCRREMAGEVSDPSGFCASLKDRVLGTEKWRNRF